MSDRPYTQSGELPAMGVIDERHTAREVRLLREGVERIEKSLETRILPAISGLGTQVGQMRAQIVAITAAQRAPLITLSRRERAARIFGLSIVALTLFFCGVAVASLVH